MSNSVHVVINEERGEKSQKYPNNLNF